MSPRRVTGLAHWTPSEQARTVVEIALELADEWPLLVRRVLYVAHERALYPDKGKRSYDSVSSYLARARRAGLLPWKAIAETTDRDEPFTYCDVKDFAAQMGRLAGDYRLDRQAGQPVRLVAWSEHRGLRVVLSETATEHGVPVVYSGGFDSVTVRYIEARAAVDRDVPTVVLHFGDRDRHGEDIVDVLRRDLSDLYRDLGGRQAAPEVVRVALTPEQVTRQGLGKSGEAVQVDALPTPVLRGLLGEAIEARQDPSVRQRVLDREAVERDRLVADVSAWTGGAP